MSKEKQSYEELITEVKEIRALLTPPPEPEKPSEEKVKGLKRVKNVGVDFLEFLKKYKIIGLAVAFIMAIYIGALVNSVVNDVIFPLLEYIPGFALLIAEDATATWEDWPFAIKIRLGALFGNIVTFIIVAFVIFLIVKISKKVGLD